MPPGLQDPLVLPPEWQSILDCLYASGVINSNRVYFERLFHDEPKLFSLRLFSVFDPTLTDGNTHITSGHSRGVSLDFEEAVSKVIGEFLERYPLTLYRRRDLLRASPRMLDRAGRRHLDLQALAGFAEWQKDLFPNRRFGDDSVFCWAEGTELLSGTRTLLPAQLIFWNYNTRQEPEEPYLRQPITNGAAGHFTREEAILAGLYELIQRDAFLVLWLNGLTPPRIDPATVNDPRAAGLLTYIARYRFDVILLNTTLDLRVPSCACLLVDRSGTGPKIAVGGGCGPSLAHALVRAMTEALGVYHWLRASARTFSLPDDYRPFRTPAINHETRLALWGEARMFLRLEPFLSGRLQSLRDAQGHFPVAFASAQEELAYIADIFRKRGPGYEVYVYDAKHELLDALGYHSVRVVVPELVPLYLRETDAPLGASRLRTIPGMMGHAPAKDPNPWPHPFP